MTFKSSLSPQLWFKVALFNLVLAGIAGIILRWAFVQEIPWLNYRNLVHGHSHTAMIGWGYLGLLSLLMAEWKDSFSKPRLFTMLFIANEVAILGMYVTFPIFGYKSIPIFFTTVHLLLSYVLAFYFIQGISRGKHGGWAVRFVKSAFLFQILSTLGIWLLPVIISMDGRNSAVYHMAVQFFLHFQFNGWYIFGIIGLFLRFLERKNIDATSPGVGIFHHFLFASCILTYALAITWSQPVQIIFWINSLGVFLQVVALWYFLKLMRRWGRQVKGQLNRASAHLLLFAGVALVIKILVQTMVIIPAIAIIAYTIKNFVIGFIHLILLGILTLYLLGHATALNWLQEAKTDFRLGWFLLVGGIISTELLLFIQGLSLWMMMGFIPYYDLMLTLLSIALWSGVFMIAISALRRNTNQPTPQAGSTII